jgi:hypothetical protein
VTVTTFHSTVFEIAAWCTPVPKPNVYAHLTTPSDSHSAEHAVEDISHPVGVGIRHECIESLNIIFGEPMATHIVEDSVLLVARMGQHKLAVETLMRNLQCEDGKEVEGGVIQTVSERGDSNLELAR